MVIFTLALNSPVQMPEVIRNLGEGEKKEESISFKLLMEEDNSKQNSPMPSATSSSLYFRMISLNNNLI